MVRPVVFLMLASACIQACASSAPTGPDAVRDHATTEPPAASALVSTDTNASTSPNAGTSSSTSSSSGAVLSADRAPEAVPDVRRDLSLPLGWDTVAPVAFEEALARWNPEGAVGRLDGDTLALLGRALDGDTPRALRAVLLLAHSAAPEARDPLLARLERHIRPAGDDFPAVDVAAAAALARRPGLAREEAEPARAAKLDELARGRRPHPLLVVRVECAAASVALGGRGASAFLLAILREGTSAFDPRPSWVRGGTALDDLAFAQWRAAEALARAAGVVNTYRPELSAVERARIAGELERALAARTATRGS